MIRLMEILSESHGISDEESAKLVAHNKFGSSWVMIHSGTSPNHPDTTIYIFSSPYHDYHRHVAKKNGE